MEDYITQAIEKLEKESKEAKGLGSKGSAVKDYVLDVLSAFCKQNNEFAQAIVQTERTFSDCVESTVKDCGSSISDLEICKKAAEFYFMGATVKFEMIIDLGDEGFSNKQTAEGNSSLNLSLDDLFD